MANLSFGEWLSRQRKAQGLTQKELALKLNCSVSEIRKIESEDRRPSVQLGFRLAEIFEIPPGERKNFLRFIKGDWQAYPQREKEASGIQGLSSAGIPGFPRSMLDIISIEQMEGFLNFSWESPQLQEKLALLLKTFETAGTTGDEHRQMEALWQLGWLDQKNRFRYWEQAITIARQIGDTQVLASGLSTIGFFLVLNGDLDLAQQYLAESNALYQQFRMNPVMSHLLAAYSQISLIQGDFTKARIYLQEHARASKKIGNREDYLWSNARLGYVAMYEGHRKDARRLLHGTAQEFKRDKNIIGVIFTLESVS